MSVKSTVAAMSMKAKVIAVCAAVAVTGGAVAAGVILSQDDSYRVLKVFELDGEAIVSRVDTGDLDAYEGMNLESGDMLTVGEDSSIRLQLDDDKYLLLDENTIIELVAEGNSADSKTSIDLKEGTILNEISNPLSDNSTYEVTTPKATMAVRGTSFTVSVKRMGNNSCIVNENTFHGLVEILLLDDDGEPTGDAYYVPAGDSTTIGGKTANDTEESVDNVTIIDYDDLPDIVVEYLLRSNNEGLIQLEQEILERLMRKKHPPETTTAAATTTTPPETTTVTTTSETTETTTVTTVPETSATEQTTTVTAVTTVPETEATTTTATAATTKETTKTTKATTKKKKKKTTTTTEKTTKKTTTTTEAATTTEEATTTTVTTVPSRPPVIYTGTPGTTPTTVPPTPTETAPTTSDSESYSSPMPSTTSISPSPSTETSSETSSETTTETEPAPVTEDTTSGSGDAETTTSGSPMPEHPDYGNDDSL